MDSLGQDIFLVKPILKVGSLNLFSAEPTFCYREILKFRGLTWKIFQKEEGINIYGIFILVLSSNISLIRNKIIPQLLGSPFQNYDSEHYTIIAFDIMITQAIW